MAERTPKASSSSVMADFRPAGFFALRTPLLPFDELSAFGRGLAAASVSLEDRAALTAALAVDRALLRARLRALVDRPEVREALFIASPALDESLAIWRSDPESERGQKVERSIVRYLARMAGRPTPFGLFAGCSVGRIGERTDLSIEGAASYRRHTRLDMYYVCALVDALVRSPSLRATLRHRPNDSLYRIAGELRFAEARTVDKVRSYHLVALELTDYLEATLRRASEGALPGDLAAGLVADDASVTLEEAAGFIDELIDGQVLVAELAPNVTGANPTECLVAELRAHPAMAPFVGPLDETTRRLRELDGEGIGRDPARYRDVATLLKELPTETELPRLFQVDMVKPAPSATLGREVIAEAVRAIELLYRLAIPPRRDPLTEFRAAFEERYQGREVPLTEVLDEENGIGFEPARGPSAEASPLLAGLMFPGGEPEGTPFSARHQLLLGKLAVAWRTGQKEIVLDERDLTALAPPRPDLPPTPPLPDSFSLMATVVAASAEHVARGEFRLCLETAGGPSGATLLGRFCHADPELHAAVKAHLAIEESARPSAIFAEIVHLPEGRLGNILSRPVLRDHEIAYLGSSGAPKDKQIAVDDLIVSIIGGRVVLRSRRRDREVIPRLTNAHNYARRSLGIYRFLCALQRQGVLPGVGFGWGALDGAPFLPRLVVGKLVLAPATWHVEAEVLAKLGEGDRDAQFAAVQRLRSELSLPRFIAVADGDNVLPIDLDNALAVETFVPLVKRRGVVELIELYPGEVELCARGPEGRFAHELVIPFERTPRSPAQAISPSKQKVKIDKGERALPPGSSWLYAKLYCGKATCDRVLRDLVAPLTDEATRTGAADQWFFIRYGDPEWHLRLRLSGSPKRLHDEVLPALTRAAAPLLEDGRLWRIELDTYDREIERYGGADATRLGERLFHADSRAVLEIVSTLSGDEGAAGRWRLALLGMDRLLDDLGFDLDRRRALLTRLRDGFGREFRVGSFFEKQLGDKFRRERATLDALWNPANEETSPYAPGIATLRRRSRELAPIAAELRTLATDGRLTVTLDDLAASYLHMHANRMLRGAAREQELVLYDFLARLYDSRAARSKKK